MNVFIPISGRSDAGLVAPVITRLEAHGHRVFKGERGMMEMAREHVIPAVALICGDRVEMIPIAHAMFLQHIPIAHLYAGITNTLATFDDINRHCITLWSDVQFCENRLAYNTVLALCADIGKTPCAFTVGTTHLDDLAVDESYVRSQPYDLILYNPPTLTNELQIELNEIKKLITGYTIALAPNKDENSDIIENNLESLVDLQYQYGLPRPLFLGLLKHCRRFITNSSVEFYEAPMWLKPEQIIHIGKRNLDRSSEGPLQTGASDKIVRILEDIYDKK